MSAQLEEQSKQSVQHSDCYWMTTSWSHPSHAHTPDWRLKTIPKRIVHSQYWRRLRRYRAKVLARFGADVPANQVDNLARLLRDDRIEQRNVARQRLEYRLLSYERQMKMFDLHGENDVSCFLPVVQRMLSFVYRKST